MVESKTIIVFDHSCFSYALALKKALIFSTKSSASIPCTIAASASDSACADGHPRQCIPMLIKTGAA